MSPPPSPPGAVDCELRPRYKLSNLWDEGAEVQVSFAGWEDHRKITMTWEDEDIDMDVANVQNAEVQQVSSEGSAVVAVFVLKSLAAVAGGGGFQPMMSFHVNPPPRHKPKVVCHDPWPSPPVAPSPPPPGPPPFPSPKPPPPPDEIRATPGDCDVSGVARVDHAMAQGTHYTLRVSVRSGSSAGWQGDREVTVGIRGEQLEATHVQHATLKQSLQEFEDYAEFTFLPEEAQTFDFNVDGTSDIGVILLSTLSCQAVGKPRPPPPPPRPPPPPPSPGESYEVYYTYDGEIVEPGQAASRGGGGGGGMVMVAVLLPLLALGAGCFVFRKKLAAALGPVSAATAPTAKRRYQAQEMEDAEEPDADSVNGGAKASSAKKTKGKWTLSIELRGEPFTLTLPMTAASHPDELKQAIAEACVANLGAEVTPQPWLEDDLSSMTVQLLDDVGEPMTMREHTDFKLVLGSPTLRITERRAAPGGARAISIED